VVAPKATQCGAQMDSVCPLARYTTSEKLWTCYQLVAIKSRRDPCGKQLERVSPGHILSSTVSYQGDHTDTSSTTGSREDPSPMGLRQGIKRGRREYAHSAISASRALCVMVVEASVS
jgi:hypothetical protein